MYALPTLVPLIPEFMLGLGAMVSGIGAGLALAVGHYRAGLFGGTVEMVRGVFGGRPLGGLGLYDALGLTLAADLGIVLGRRLAVKSALAPAEIICYHRSGPGVVPSG